MPGTMPRSTYITSLALPKRRWLRSLFPFSQMRKLRLRGEVQSHRGAITDPVPCHTLTLLLQGAHYLPTPTVASAWNALAMGLGMTSSF